MTMQLLQVKLRCLEGIIDSGWFKPGRNLTYIYGSDREKLSQILRGLEALNPLYDIATRDPLAHYPPTWQQGEYQRHVIKEKKTAVFVVFAAEPQLVRVLGLLDDSLLETDRIEFGRRLDYSRWISFVELSASARWSDIASEMHTLKNDQLACAQIPASKEEEFFSARKMTDRIKGELAEKCRKWLLAHRSCWSGDSTELYLTCLRKVTLHERFKLAGKVAEEIVPPMVRLQPEIHLQEEYSFAQLMLPPNEHDPIAKLLKQVCDRFSLPSKNREDLDRLRKSVSDVSSMPVFAPLGSTLSIDEVGFSLVASGRALTSQRVRSLSRMSVVAMLTQLLWQRFPIFLLDGYDKDIIGPIEPDLAALLGQFGAVTQIILTSGSAEHQLKYDFVKTLFLTDDGQIEEK